MKRLRLHTVDFILVLIYTCLIEFSYVDRKKTQENHFTDGADLTLPLCLVMWNTVCLHDYYIHCTTFVYNYQSVHFTHEVHKSVELNDYKPRLLL